MNQSKHLIDYSRFHEILVKMNPSQAWGEEFVNDARACNGDISQFPYIKKISNNIDFEKKASYLKESLQRQKTDIEFVINYYNKIKDENYNARLKLCNECLEMKIDTYEKLEFVSFVENNLKDLATWQIEEYKEEHERLITAIISTFVSIDIAKTKSFSFFGSFQNIFVQILFLPLFIALVTIPIEASFCLSLIDFSLLITAAFVGIFYGIFLGIPFIFIYLFIHEKDMKFINKEILSLDEENPLDSFKENSKRVIKTGAIVSLITKIFSSH